MSTFHGSWEPTVATWATLSSFAARPQKHPRPLLRLLPVLPRAAGEFKPPIVAFKKPSRSKAGDQLGLASGAGIRGRMSYAVD